MTTQETLAIIYYKIGKQATDYSVQHSHRNGEDVVWSKRQTFTALDPDKDKRFIDTINHRQILKNEIIIDIDKLVPASLIIDDEQVSEIIYKLTEDGWRFAVFHTGSKGVHIHVYNNNLITLNRKEREDYRVGFIKKFLGPMHIDMQKSSDACMIALENTPHWKTGNKKRLIYERGLDEWQTLT